MTEVDGLHHKWMQNEEYRKAHEELAPEFALARPVLGERLSARITRARVPLSPHQAVATTPSGRPTRREASPAAAPG
jgi:hypothetical protein